MWDDLLTVGVPIADKIVRTVVVYLALLVLLRLVGKRDLAQLNSFDLVVMLLLANVVQNAIIGDDNSLLGGLIGAVTLLAVNWLVAWLAAGPARFGRLLEGQAEIIAEDGRYRWPALRRLGLRRADVDVAIRRQGAAGVGETKRVSLEPGGTVLVEFQPGKLAATRDDLAALERRLATIERQLAALLDQRPR
ncbi:MAG TPA: YetF domain-containing protein [Natronosporangium sp.]